MDQLPLPPTSLSAADQTSTRSGFKSPVQPELPHVEELPAEPGLEGSYETVRLGFDVRARVCSKASTVTLTTKRPAATSTRWWSVSLASGCYLWRAAADEGEVPDMFGSAPPRQARGTPAYARNW
jgi:hypothetical protein